MPGKDLSHSAWMAVSGSALVRRLAPFAAAAATGIVVASTAAGLDAGSFWAAVALALAAGALVLWLPWGRLPSWTGAVPALVFIGSVALLRDAAGGATAGTSPLLLLPVLWLGLYGTRTQLAIVAPAVGAAFFIPILLVGGQLYPSSQWRLGVLYVAVSLLIGSNVQRLIRSVKSQATTARRSQLEIARVAEVARALSTGEGTRRDVCGAACEIGDASFALLAERTDAGKLTVSAAAGMELPNVEIDPSRDRSVTAKAFRSAMPVFVADSATDARISRRLLELVPTTGSVLFQPVMGRGEPVGVLLVGWAGVLDADQERMRMMVGLLAAEAAIAIERADLMTRLEELADTDELTGLPNRRGWNRELAIALATAGRRKSDLCVALIDVDHFKLLNDERGHQAGDRLLKEAAAAWRHTLRPADVLARPGGDEFTLVLPDCDLDRAQMVLERLRAATPGERTCSIGVAQWAPGEKAEMLVARADDALYSAKDAGRDRVVAA